MHQLNIVSLFLLLLLFSYTFSTKIFHKTLIHTKDLCIGESTVEILGISAQDQTGVFFLDMGDISAEIHELSHGLISRRGMLSAEAGNEGAEAL